MGHINYPYNQNFKVYNVPCGGEKLEISKVEASTALAHSCETPSVEGEIALEGWLGGVEGVGGGRVEGDKTAV